MKQINESGKELWKNNNSFKGKFIDEFNGMDNESVSPEKTAQQYGRIDKFFMILFPILFSLFNIIYWFVFLL